MPAVLFGSISTLADTSELQRNAFNEAFEAHGLDWQWDRQEYLDLLEHSGGEDRIAEYARSAGQDVDAQAVHQTKSEVFQTSLAEARLSARPGVVETVREAKDNGYKVGFVTTTSRENISALMEAVREDVADSDFDVIADASSVEQPKPDKAAYSFALQRLGEQPESCVAIEDNLGGVEAAKAAGLHCIAFPNENTAGHDFAEADRRVDRVSFSEVQSLAT
jgi:HAD superfamily hydrolase (TIGR01509 family)